MSINMSQLGLAPTPLILVKPERSGRLTLPQLRQAAPHEEAQQVSTSRLLVQMQQQQQQQQTHPPPPSPSVVSPSSAPASSRISIAIRPRMTLTLSPSQPAADAAHVPADASTAIRIQSPVTSPASMPISTPITINLRRSSDRHSATFASPTPAAVPSQAIPTPQATPDVKPTSEVSTMSSDEKSISPPATPVSLPLATGTETVPISSAQPTETHTPQTGTQSDEEADEEEDDGEDEDDEEDDESSSSTDDSYETGESDDETDEPEVPPDTDAQVLVISRADNDRQLAPSNRQSAYSTAGPSMNELTSSRRSTLTSRGDPSRRLSGLESARGSLLGLDSFRGPSLLGVESIRGLKMFSAGNSNLVLPSSDVELDQELCGVCENYPAEVHCIDCALNFCAAGQCNRTTHAPIKMRAHTRVPIMRGGSNGQPHAVPLTSTAATQSRPGTGSGAGGFQPVEPSAPNTQRSRGRSSLHSPSELHSPTAASAAAAEVVIPSAVSPLPSPTSPPVLTSRPSLPRDATGLASDSTSDSDSDDDTDALALAKEAYAATITGPSCDQCHLAPAVVYCIDCASSLCDSIDGSVSCNKRIHKARAMARHRQVKVSERDEVVQQLEEVEEAAIASPMAPRAHAHSMPRASFIAPLSSRSSLVSSITPKRSSFGGAGSPGGMFGAALAIGGPGSAARTPSPSAAMISPDGSRSRASSVFTPTQQHQPRPPLTPTGLVPRPPPSPANGQPPRHRLSSGGANAGDEEPEFDPEFSSPAPRSRRSSLAVHRPSPRLMTPTPPAIASPSAAAIPSPSAPSTDTEPPSSGSATATPAVLPAAVVAAMSSDPRPCSNCDSHLASSYCLECAMFLCSGEGQCQQLIHRPTRMKQHQIFPLPPPQASSTPTIPAPEHA